MKRWTLLVLVGATIAGGSLGILLHIMNAPPPVPLNHLVRTSNSAYKYHLCTEAFAFTAQNTPFKTDFTFHDPFRNANDTIIPILQKSATFDKNVSFRVKIIINQVATFNETIAHVQALDGISVLLPDTHNQLQRSSEPQFIVDTLDRNAQMAVLDYTCPEQWVWKATNLS